MTPLTREQIEQALTDALDSHVKYSADESFKGAYLRARQTGSPAKAARIMAVSHWRAVVIGAVVRALLAPPCPWCGDEISDSPGEDFDGAGSIILECAGCGQPVEVAGRMVAHYKARKAKEQP
jgi:hypothetical protein